MNQANLPTNATASSCRCGNALPHTHQTREHYQPGGGSPGQVVRRVNQQLTGRGSTPGEAGGFGDGGVPVTFRHQRLDVFTGAPAPFTAPIGATHQLLVTAYGYSKPVQSVGRG